MEDLLAMLFTNPTGLRIEGTLPKINAHLEEIADEVLGLRQPAAAFRHAACCERGKRRFHRAFPGANAVGLAAGLHCPELQQAVAVQGVAGSNTTPIGVGRVSIILGKPTHFQKQHVEFVQNS